MAQLKLGKFLKQIHFGYLLFTSLIIVGVIFGAFEIIEKTLFADISIRQLRWLHFSRGIISSLLLMIWAAWTVYQYRELYEEKLEIKERRYRDIIESSADAIFTMDTRNFITSWNNGAEQIFGWKRDEIIGKPVETIIPDDLLEAKELECIAYGLREKGYVSSYETERIDKDGRRKKVILSVTVLRDEKDKIEGRSVIMRDVTELRLRDEQFQRSERLATVGHMAAGVAHEVGNPLTAISSLVQVLQRKTDDEFIQVQLKKVREHIKRITKIVRDLVDFSRPASADITRAQVNDIIESAVGLLKHDARCRDVRFKLDLDKDLPKVNCIPDHVHQVLVNLFLNAVDALEDEDVPEIITQTERSNNHIIIKVSDKGMGMSEEVQQRIFEPFFTTKDVGSGTGLGLSVSHGIISKMNGSIHVDSTEGEGTTFTIELPIDKSKSAA